MEISRAEISILGVFRRAALLEGAGVEDADDLAGEGVRDVGDELEGVVEGADDEAVVAAGLSVGDRTHFLSDRLLSLQSERAFDEIKAY